MTKRKETKPREFMIETMFDSERYERCLNTAIKLFEQNYYTGPSISYSYIGEGKYTLKYNVDEVLKLADRLYKKTTIGEKV